MDISAFNSFSWKSIESVLESIDDNKHKGDLFECFSYFYLKFYSHLYDINEIYCPIVDGKNFPKKILDRLKLEKKDHGVDGVYINNKGEYIAWQAKFRSNRTPLTSRELSTFWAEAEYAEYRLVISNTKKLPPVAHKKSGHLSILSDKFEALTKNFYEEMNKYFNTTDKSIVIQRKTPRDYQTIILEDIREGFSKTNKGKVIAACGIGKTLLSIWSAEEMQAKRVVFFAPSLQLVRQTLEKWSIESTRKFSYLCVCSDQSVDSEVDRNNISLEEIDIPVTTDEKEIYKFLSSKNDDEFVYIFSTYQSANVIGDALMRMKGWEFDVAIYDEAHRTAGIGEDSKFSQALVDKVIPTKRKLFLTATERLLRPRLTSSANERGVTAFSMNNEDIYGPVFSRLTFGDAINKNIISDYRIVFSGISNSELAKIASSNLYIKDDLSGDNKTEAINNLFKRTILKRTISDLGTNKIISFHSKISEAKLFSELLSKEISNNNGEDIEISHINGGMSAQERAEIIHDFENSDIGVISNVRCLTEGIDIPLIDGVFFADPKGSLIDIVQAVGRALRQDFGQEGKIAYIIVPVLIDDTSDDILTGQGFESLFNLIQALRDQDHELSEWIDSINSSAVRGRSHKGGELGKINLKLPKEIDYSLFEESLALRISDVNKDPTGTIGIGSQLGKSERKGSITRVFKTIMDYTPVKCEESLVLPTLELMEPGEIYSGKQIKINNNNVSHCKRIGITREVSKSNYQLTKLGALLKNDKITFNDLFKNQIMLYGQEKGGLNLFPYREAFLFIKEIKSFSFVQFVYSLYSIGFDEDNKPDLNKAIAIAQEIDKNYPNIDLTNEANKNDILNELNTSYHSEFSFANVWTDRTTIGNQYRYLIRHLELFDDVFTFTDKCIQLKAGRERKVDELLSKSGSYLATDTYGDVLWFK